MGMGHAGAYADVIEQESIRKFCPKELNEFEGELVDGKSEVNMDEFAKAAETNDLDGHYDKDLVKSYENLCKVFEKKTGLELGIACHNSEEEGDRYDEVDGIYWYVNGMYQLSPAGKKMKKYVERKSFVQFG